MNHLLKAGSVLLILLFPIPIAQAQDSNIPGYTYGNSALPQSPVSLDDLTLLKKTLLLTEEDEKYLRMSYDVLSPQIDDILDVWYGFVASNEHLVYYFSDKNTKSPDGEYLQKVRVRFGKWILDTAKANYDQKWLDYQHQIAIRHHRSGKNKTDNVSSVDHIHFRYLIALHYPVTATLKPFLAKSGHSVEDIEKMHQAWIKSVLLQTILWSHPYINDGDF